MTCKTYLGGLLFRLGKVVLYPFLIPLAVCVLVLAWTCIIIGGSFQWLFTGKSSMFNLMDDSTRGVTFMF